MALETDTGIGSRLQRGGWHNSRTQTPATCVVVLPDGRPKPVSVKRDPVGTCHCGEPIYNAPQHSVDFGVVFECVKHTPEPKERVDLPFQKAIAPPSGAVSTAPRRVER